MPGDHLQSAGLARFERDSAPESHGRPEQGDLGMNASPSRSRRSGTGPEERSAAAWRLWTDTPSTVSLARSSWSAWKFDTATWRNFPTFRRRAGSPDRDSSPYQQPTPRAAQIAVQLTAIDASQQC